MHFRKIKSITVTKTDKIIYKFKQLCPIIFIPLSYIYYLSTMHGWLYCVLSWNTRSMEQKMAVVICRILENKLDFP